MMPDEQRDSGAPESDRKQDGGGAPQALPGSESARGNAEPRTQDAAPGADHARRTIPGTDGPIEIVEDSGAAAGDLHR